MSIGDLVNFYSAHAPFQDQYNSKNPGIVLDIIFSKRRKRIKEGQESIGQVTPSAQVMWSDGTFTKEFVTYLKVIRT